LDAERAFDFVEVEIFARSLVPAKNSFRRNKLSRKNVRSILFAELAKNLVRDPGHRREKKRETILKPGQTHFSGFYFLTELGIWHPLGIFLSALHPVAIPA
jgi:hypothetical protein